MNGRGRPQLVCEDCIGEPLLKREITQKGRLGICMCCKSDEHPAVTLEWLAERVKPIYELLVTPAPEEIRFDRDRVYTAPSGEYPSDILTDLIEAEDRNIAEAMIAIMGRGHEWRFRDGGIDIYDESEEFEILEPDGSLLRKRWIDFCSSLKHKRRFFNEDGVDVLDEVFGPVLRGEHSGDAVRTIGPGHADRFIYRARQANDDGGRRTIFGRLINQLSAPIPGTSGAGRMNAAGIAVFYGSFDIETCVAELRIPVGGAAVVGKFEIIKPLRILDLTRLATTAEALSYFAPRYAEIRAYSDFIEGFHQEIRRAVIPGRENLDYLPTQVVAEYLWSQADPPIDGLIFGSAQISESANNIVLFPHASTVAGAEAERQRTVDGMYRSTPYDEDDKVTGPAEERVLFEPLPEHPEPRRSEPFDAEEDWFVGLGSTEPAALEPALRLLTEEVSIVEVTGIHVDIDTVPVRFSDRTDFGF